MKRILTVVMILCLVSAPLFAGSSESLEMLRQEGEKAIAHNERIVKITKIAGTFLLCGMGYWGYSQKSTYGYVTGTFYFIGGFRMAFDL